MRGILNRSFLRGACGALAAVALLELGIHHAALANCCNFKYCKTAIFHYYATAFGGQGFEWPYAYAYGETRSPYPEGGTPCQGRQQSAYNTPTVPLCNIPSLSGSEFAVIEANWSGERGDYWGSAYVPTRCCNPTNPRCI